MSSDALLDPELHHSSPLMSFVGDLEPVTRVGMSDSHGVLGHQQVSLPGPNILFDD